MPKRQNAEAVPGSVHAVQDEVFFEAFRLARLHGELRRAGPLAPGQAQHHPAGPAMFHFLRGAACEVAVEPAAGTRARAVRLRLAPGELLLLPHGNGHRIAACGAHGVELTSGVFGFEAYSGVALMRGLPEIVHVRTGEASSPGLDRANLAPHAELDRMAADAVGPDRVERDRAPPGCAGQSTAADEAAQWLALTFAAMRKEAQAPSLGSRAMIARLIDMVFIWSVRHWLAQAPPGQVGWLAALRDPLLARALALLHAEPARHWSVPALAARLHQSRSGLSQRFAAGVGEPPMRYLARWRMQLAADLLARTDLRMGQIAVRVGYASEAALARSFRRQFGMAPSAYRERARG